MLRITSDSNSDAKESTGCQACPRGFVQITEYQGFETISYTFALSDPVMPTTPNNNSGKGFHWPIWIKPSLTASVTASDGDEDGYRIGPRTQ